MALEHAQVRGLSEWQPLARGGFAVVWKARQLSLDRLVAVKVYSRTLDDEGQQRRFLQEAAAAGRLSNHPGIVTVHDAGILPDERPYLLMELCPGGSLTAWLQEGQRPSEDRVRQVGVRIADALAAAHAGGVLHRDVKPANILMNTYGVPELSDFGLAAVSSPQVELTPEALHITPTYAPPETLRGQPATEFGDVFSLAATLYALLAGRPPRQVESTPATRATMSPLAEQRIEPLADVDWHLMDLLMTALSDNSAARPTAARFRDQLSAVDLPVTGRRAAFGPYPVVPARERGAEGHHLLHPPSRTLVKARRRQRRAASLLSVTLAVASFALGAFAVWMFVV